MDLLAPLDAALLLSSKSSPKISFEVNCPSVRLGREEGRAVNSGASSGAHILMVALSTRTPSICWILPRNSPSGYGFGRISQAPLRLAPYLRLFPWHPLTW